MEISVVEIQTIADLARLRLDQSEIAKFQKELTAVLDYVACLEDVNREDDFTINRSNTVKYSLRDDLIQPSLSKSSVLENSPSITDGMFNVPKVI
jgi:aspartyl-tRNA(Asn)/glutamyl-tRNA(Gln) amidotransferase subunit C